MTTSAHEYQTSKIVARTLTEAITDGKQQCDGASLAASQAKNAQAAIRKEREKEELDALRSCGNISTRRLELLQEKGTSSWLTAIPVDDHDLFLHKGEKRTNFIDNTQRCKRTQTIDAHPILKIQINKQINE